MLPNSIWSTIRKQTPFSKPLLKYFVPGLTAKVSTHYAYKITPKHKSAIVSKLHSFILVNVFHS